MRWIFSNLPNPSSNILALGSTQPLTDEYQESSWGVKGGWMPRKADNLMAICELSRKCVSFDVSQTYGPPWPVTGDSSTFYFNTKLSLYLNSSLSTAAFKIPILLHFE
jgi:hypothetical protein